MTSYAIIYFKHGDRSPIDEFLDEIDKQARDKCLRQIGLLKEYGVTVDNPNLKRLKGYKYSEVRILGKDNIRIFCFQHNRMIHIIHILRKKSQKTSTTDLNIGEKRMSFILTNDI